MIALGHVVGATLGREGGPGRLEPAPRLGVATHRVQHHPEVLVARRGLDEAADGLEDRPRLVEAVDRVVELAEVVVDEGEVEGAHGHRLGSLAGHQRAAGRGQERGGAGEVAEIVGDHAPGQLGPGQPVRTVLELAALDLDVEQGGRLGVAALGPQLRLQDRRSRGAGAPVRGAVGSAPLATGPGYRRIQAGSGRPQGGC